MKKQLFFTKTGYEEMQKEYKNLFDKRKEAVKTLAKAREMGDLSENGFYKAAKFELGNIDRRKRELGILLKHAAIAPNTNAEIVSIGSTVRLFDGNKKNVYKIVNTYESDSRKGKLSDISPLGKMLLGKRKGDSVLLSTPQQTTEYTILEII